LETAIVRCPDCAKRYLINLGKISSSAPVFRCQSCQSRFTVDLASVSNGGDAITHSIGKVRAAKLDGMHRNKLSSAVEGRGAGFEEIREGFLESSIEGSGENRRDQSFSMAFWIMIASLFISITFVLVGLSLEPLRNLVGIGASLCVLSLGLAYWQMPSRSE
jgi:predicted Zn finger-like uncharacterized protein